MRAIVARPRLARIPEVLSPPGRPRADLDVHRCRHCNLLLRDDEEGLRFCAAGGIASVPFFPIRNTAHPTVSAVAARHAATDAQIALARLLHRDEHVLLIPGTASLTHLEENMAAARIVLHDEDRAALADVHV